MKRLALTSLATVSIIITHISNLLLSNYEINTNFALNECLEISNLVNLRNSDYLL